jgi:hypothetical protein
MSLIMHMHKYCIYTYTALAYIHAQMYSTIIECYMRLSGYNTGIYTVTERSVFNPRIYASSYVSTMTFGVMSVYEAQH